METEVNFNAVLEALDSEETSTCSVNLISFASNDTVSVNEGTTVSELKEKFNLSSSVKLVDNEGNILSNSDTITTDCVLFASKPKENA